MVAAGGSRGRHVGVGPLTPPLPPTPTLPLTPPLPLTPALTLPPRGLAPPTPCAPPVPLASSSAGTAIGDTPVVWPPQPTPSRTHTIPQPPRPGNGIVPAQTDCATHVACAKRVPDKCSISAPLCLRALGRQERDRADRIAQIVAGSMDSAFNPTGGTNRATGRQVDQTFAPA
jgi:hypothetical protein